MKIVKLYSTDAIGGSNDIYVNLNDISYYFVNGERTRLVFSNGNSISVFESIATINNLLKDIALISEDLT